MDFVSIFVTISPGIVARRTDIRTDHASAFSGLVSSEQGLASRWSPDKADLRDNFLKVLSYVCSLLAVEYRGWVKDTTLRSSAVGTQDVGLLVLRISVPLRFIFSYDFTGLNAGFWDHWEPQQQEAARSVATNDLPPPLTGSKYGTEGSLNREPR
ncbi:hypothetical protein RRG08_039964 [Elysia crispata]|uniref:Uncharacterized protein n=1 Tax=Elysia crispata TaxID=231223 RepID=A0AAE1DCH4_9GAST|nr:hypothetical protein RRG08_039964 [Elysia crispata]